MSPRRSSLAARLAAITLAIAPLSGAGSSFAQAPPSVADKETARTLMNAGDDHFDAKDYAGALKAYAGADAIMHLPMTGIAVARAEAALGQLLEARDTALQVARLPVQAGENSKFAEARAEAQALANSLEPRVPSLDLAPSASPPGLVVSVDDAPVPAAALGLPRKVNPGKHVVTARAPGFSEARVEITVAERAALRVALAMVPSTTTATPTPPTAPTPTPIRPEIAPVSRSSSPLVYVGFGIGGASLIAGAVTGGLSLSKTSGLKTSCPGMLCPAGSAGASDRAAAGTLANISNVTLALGVAGVVTGIVGVVLSRGDKPPASSAAVTPVIGPGTLGVVGTF